jgi:3-hydroxyacyl-CoA dehydrogenase
VIFGEIINDISNSYPRATTMSSLSRSAAACQRILRPATARAFSSTPSLNFDKVGIIGLGLMGHGIAQTAATAAATKNLHSSVVAYESDKIFLDKGRDRIQSSIDKLVKKDKMTSSQADDVLNKIVFTTDRSALSDADFIVEAIIENMDLKKNLYSSLGKECKAGTIFASNTSSLSITEMALASGRPEKFVGVHFFNPVQIMKLVEVIRTEYTSMEVFDKTVAWVGDVGKVPVKCRDTPGFIVNRLLVPNLMQAILLLERGDATTHDIDISMQLGAGHPMGPLHLADYVGLDTCLYIMEGWVKDFPGEGAFVVPEILKQKVARGELGRKSGKGFYYWDGEKREDPVGMDEGVNME